MTRGEKPIELADSWFSAKSIEVEHNKQYDLRILISLHSFLALLFCGLALPKAKPTPQEPKQLVSKNFVQAFGFADAQE